MLQRLMAIEWIKMRKYKAFWIMLSLFVLGFFGLVYIIYAIKYEAPADLIGNFLDSFFRYPTVGRLTAYMGSYMFIVLGIILITQIANEFSFRTHRQNVIDGLSRTQFINAKWEIVVLLSVFAALIHVGFTALFALMGDGGTISGFVSSLKYSLFFFLDSLMWLSVALIIGLLVKRSGLAITIFMVYVLIVENTLGFLIKQSFDSSIGDYLPISIADGLNPNILIPFTNQTGPTESVAMVITCIYLVVLYLFSKRMINKMDLK